MMNQQPSPPARSTATAIFQAALAAADPAEAVLRALRLHGELLRVGGDELDLDEIRSIWLLGAGKAARGMAAGALELLGSRVTGGCIVVPDGLGRPLPPIDVWEAHHPLPDTRGLAAAAEALNVAHHATDEDLILCLLSGGASALWAAPAGDITLADLQWVTGELLRAGATIQELNTVRRQLSRIGGGRLAAAASPARVLTLAISDVLGGAPEDIGSGPTSPDPTGYEDALQVLAVRGVQPPPAVRHHLQAAAAGEWPRPMEVAEPDRPHSFHVVTSIREALAAAAEEAVRLGYAATVVSDRLEGAARVMGEQIARAALEARGSAGVPRALLWGGETTVEVRGAGRGGRNQELALAAALTLQGAEGITLAALATDGIDGPTPAAGAVVDSGTVQRGTAAGSDAARALAGNDSHTFLNAAGDLLVTGPTGTNVNDIVVVLVD